MLSQVLKSSDVVLDMNGKILEAAIFMNDWVFEVNIGELNVWLQWLRDYLLIYCKLVVKTPSGLWFPIGRMPL